VDKPLAKLIKRKRNKQNEEMEKKYITTMPIKFRRFHWGSLGNILKTNILIKWKV
jgi:hypothetical protein